MVNQKFKDFEIIFINDGSNDNSAQIVESFLRGGFLSGKIISQKNLGVSAARNNGISHSVGELITFVDSDDILSPFYLSQFVQYYLEYRADLMICDFLSFGKENEIKESTKVNTTNGVELLDASNLMRRFLFGDLKISMGSFMLRRELIHKHKLNFAIGYKWDEDYHFIWRMLSHSKNILLNHSPLYFYRKRQGSAMTAFNSERLRGIELIQEIQHYLIKNNSAIAPEYSQYGLARWLWSLTWQAACALPFQEFVDFCFEINFKDWIPRLSNFPDTRVRISSKILGQSRFLFYQTARLAACVKGVNRF